MAEQENSNAWQARRARLIELLDDIANGRASQAYAHSEIADMTIEIARLDRLIEAGGNGDQATSGSRRQ